MHRSHRAKADVTLLLQQVDLAAAEGDEEAAVALIEELFELFDDVGEVEEW